jgi:hypothetical protein
VAYQLYKLHSWGEQIGEGATQPHLVAVAGVAKRSKPESPYVVANELLCGTLGRAIGLPIPPGFLVEHDGEVWHVSLNFNLASESLPPVNAATFVAAHPELAAGIIVLDEWVLNGDRHSKNMAHYEATGKAIIFDHSHAFLGEGQKGAKRLNEKRHTLGIDDHFLRGHVTKAGLFAPWVDRIKALPEVIIREAVRNTETVGVSQELADTCITFLLERREELLDILKKERDKFPKVEPTLWDGI